MNKKDILYVLFALIVSSGMLFVGYKKPPVPEEVYRVYLKGETIGYIKNKELLEEYIDNEQAEIKDKYKVDKVYLPNELDIVKEVTYNKNISTDYKNAQFNIRSHHNLATNNEKLLAGVPGLKLGLLDFENELKLYFLKQM